MNQIAFMLASAGLPHVSDIAAGIAAVADGEDFIVDPVTGADGQVYRRVGTEAEFLGWYHSGSGVSGLMIACHLRNEEDRADYEYDFKANVNGQFVINTGTVADSCPQPGIQMFGASGIMFDGDGVENGERLVWPAGLENRDGREECISVTFDNVNDEHHLIYKYALDDIPQGTWKLVAGMRMDAPEPLILGSMHDTVGDKVSITPTGSFTDYAVDVTWGSSDFWSIAVRPDGNLPMVVEFDRVAAYPQHVKVPSLEEARTVRLAGHASPAFAVPDVLTVEDGAWRPTEAASALHINLPGTEVTDFRFSGYFDVEDETYPVSYIYPLAFEQESRPGEDGYELGSFQYAVSDANEEYHGRMIARAGDSNDPFIMMMDTVLVGFGQHRLDLQLSGDGVDAAQLAQSALPGEKHYRGYLNSIPQFSVPAPGLPSGFCPKDISIGGTRPNSPKAADATDMLKGAIARPRIDLNKPTRTYERIKAEFLRDKDLGLVNPEPVTFSIFTEGNSKERFSGASVHHMARLLAGPGRIFTNISQGGSFWFSQTGDVGLLNAFNRPERHQMRLDVLDATVNVNECPLTIWLWMGGENNPTHLADPASAYTDIRTLFVDQEAALFDDPNGRRVVPVISTVPPTGAGGVNGYENGLKEEWNAYLRSLFTVPTASPYLFKSANPSATGFVYLVDRDAWAPRQRPEEGGKQFADWYECVDYAETLVFTTTAAAQAAGPNRFEPLLGQYKITGSSPYKYYRHGGTSDPGGDSFAVTFGNSETHYYLFERNTDIGSGVISSDRQHYTGTFGGNTEAEDVLAPMGVTIAADYGVTL